MSIYKFDHHIQAKIFSILRTHSTARYRDLKDPGLESSQFMYHLNGLIRSKLVEKTKQGDYQLAPAGIELAQHFSSTKNNVSSAPLTYSLIFLRAISGKWAVLFRKKHPHFHQYACISGKVHIGETLHQAASRELDDLTSGLVTQPLEYRGYLSVMVTDKAHQTHVTGPVWFIDKLPEIDFPETRHGILSWEDWETLHYDAFIPGWREIVLKLETSSPFFLDLAYTVE